MKINPSVAVNTQPVDKQDAKLKKACQDFEALLVTQMLSAMRQTVPKNDLFGSSEKEEVFQGMLDQETAVQMSRTGSLKIAELMYSQLSRSADTKPEAEQSTQIRPDHSIAR